MSFHGGVIGTSLGILYFARKEKLSWLRIHDYVACCVPFGLFFGRLANFVNQELWGAPTNVPWAIRFVEINALRRRCSARRAIRASSTRRSSRASSCSRILGWMFWKTQARYEPGKLVGAFLFFYGLFRFGIEFIREPDQQLIGFAQATGLHMGQWLSLPMILGGAVADVDRQAAAGCASNPTAGHRRRFVTPLERALRDRIRGRRADQRRSLYGSLQRLLLRDPRPARRARRFHHRARDQPDVRRDGRRLPGRCAGRARGRRPTPSMPSLGPGRGTLAGDALRVLRCAGFAGEVHLVETSPVLRGRQAGRARRAVGTMSVDELPARPLLLVANEFLDALPIRQYVGGVGAASAVAAGGLAFDRDGEIVETSPARDEAVAAIATCLAQQGRRRVVHRLWPRAERRRATRCRRCAAIASPPCSTSRASRTSPRMSISKRSATRAQRRRRGHAGRRSRRMAAPARHRSARAGALARQPRAGG